MNTAQAEKIIALVNNMPNDERINAMARILREWGIDSSDENEIETLAHDLIEALAHIVEKNYRAARLQWFASLPESERLGCDNLEDFENACADEADEGWAQTVDDLRAGLGM